VGVHSTVLVNGVIVTVLTFLFFLLGNQTPLDRIASEMKPWITINGVCGFTILTIAALTFPRLGAASVIVLMISGQLITAVTLDHFAILNLPQHPISIARLLGVALVVLGAFLTTRA
jgi:transporter family-2 protein